MNDKFNTFQKEYEELLPISNRTCEVVKNEIEKLFGDNGISLGFPIQTRVKKWDSIFDKVNSGRFNIKKTLLELQDLVSVRIILLFKSDADKVCELLKNNFTEINIYNAGDKLRNDQFGYTSTHIIAKIPIEWTTVPSFNDLDKIQFEIQIRTLSQHMWAEVSNTFQYKQEQNVPKELLRSIGRASALLEIVDLEFNRLIIERQSYKSEIHLTEEEAQGLTLNVDLLSATLDKMLPPENKDDYEDYASLLSDLVSSDINTIEELNSLITKYLSLALEDDKKLIEDPLVNNTALSIRDRERMRNGVFYSHEGLIRTMLQVVNPKLFFARD